MKDIVIDTNVLVHSMNPGEVRFAATCQFLRTLVECMTLVCVDEGFDMVEGKNRSLIGSEYLGHVRAGSLAYEVLVRLAQDRRISEVTRRAHPRTRRLINQSVRNRRDRTFLAVAVNSVEKTLVSHDFSDFDVRKRQYLRQRIGVGIVEAEPATRQLMSEGCGTL